MQKTCLSLFGCYFNRLHINKLYRHEKSVMQLDRNQASLHIFVLKDSGCLSNTESSLPLLGKKVST